jgi:16S rRNA (uracil1498-N3)-methyltransferase
VERNAHSAVACFHAEGPLEIGATIALGERVAHHVNVRRIETGDLVAVTNGAGSIAHGRVIRLAKREIEVSIERVGQTARPPELHLCAPVADRDRMLWAAEKATELGITSWQSVRFRRSGSVSPRGEGPTFAEKLRARMIGALEQSSGAWLPRMLPETTPAGVEASGSTRLVLDVGGEPIVEALSARDSSFTILVGPEGGLEADELATLVANSWRPVSLGSSTLRFETAVVAAIAVIRAVQASQPSFGASSSGQ